MGHLGSKQVWQVSTGHLRHSWNQHHLLHNHGGNTSQGMMQQHIYTVCIVHKNQMGCYSGHHWSRQVNDATSRKIGHCCTQRRVWLLKEHYKSKECFNVLLTKRRKTFVVGSVLEEMAKLCIIGHSPLLLCTSQWQHCHLVPQTNKQKNKAM